MSFEQAGGSAGIDGAKILVWGAIGDELKKLDSKRMMALLQQNPKFHLSVLANMDTEKLIQKLIELYVDEDTDAELTEEIEEMIYQINYLDNVFFEATEFLHNMGDMLSTGSFMTGEFEQKQAILKLMGQVPQDEKK